ncbi:hypothetical protein ACUXEY_000789 [Bacillus sp. F9_6S_D1_P_5]
MIKYCKKAEFVKRFLFIDAKIIYAAANINGKKETVEYGK